MARLLAVTVVLALGGCGSVQTTPSSTSLSRSGGVMEVAVGGRMVDNTSTTMTVTAMSQASRVEGVRAEFVYLGFLGSDPQARSTIRVRYAEHKVANGVEAERPEYWAEVDLDLARGRTIEFKGWRIEVLEATVSSIRYEVVGSPAP
jgi:uncharacterized protein YceK